MAALNKLDDLFLHTLKDVYYAEGKIDRALPMMAEKASEPKLAEAFRAHQKETETQIDRLKKVFGMLDVAPSSERCDAIHGILDEAESQMTEAGDDETRDAAMAAAAQAVEHYEIARYGTLCAYAKRLGHDDAAKLLGETLAEEKATDEKLTKLAEDMLNRKAA